MSRLPLPDKILAIDRALAAIPHAFGGAISLAYHAEPRATIDIDVNVFVPVDRAADVFDPLSQLGAEIDSATETVNRDGQARIMWDNTPVDLFFSYDPFHAAADASAIVVPFADHTIRILSATHLSVCKAVFDRPKDLDRHRSHDRARHPHRHRRGAALGPDGSQVTKTLGSIASPRCSAVPVPAAEVTLVEVT